MDARLDPYAILGLEPGDAHVIRNAGGLATDDAIRSLALSQHLLGTDTVILIQHTDCGMSKITDEDFAVQMEQATGRRPEWTAGAFSDLEMSVRESLRRLEQSPFLRHGSARGFIYEVETGELREVNSP
jgi:carbonic anhydrase